MELDSIEELLARVKKIVKFNIRTHRSDFSKMFEADPLLKTSFKKRGKAITLDNVLRAMIPKRIGFAKEKVSWASDNIIEFYIQMKLGNNSMQFRQWGTEIGRLLRAPMKRQDEWVNRYKQREGQNRAENILWPVHYQNHWSLIHLDLKDKLVRHYDSLPNYDRDQQIARFLEKVEANLQWEPTQGYRQNDNINCGYLVMLTVEEITTGKLNTEKKTLSAKELEKFKIRWTEEIIREIGETRDYQRFLEKTFNTIKGEDDSSSDNSDIEVLSSIEPQTPMEIQRSKASKKEEILRSPFGYLLVQKWVKEGKIQEVLPLEDINRRYFKGRLGDKKQKKSGTKSTRQQKPKRRRNYKVKGLTQVCQDPLSGAEGPSDESAKMKDE